MKLARYDTWPGVIHVNYAPFIKSEYQLFYFALLQSYVCKPYDNIYHKTGYMTQRLNKNALLTASANVKKYIHITDITH